uniref:EOG090X0ILG n=1 Tax=Lynceus sp. MCZ IZ 141354 TaxID=1930659 RepID=A0A9N6WZJ0_9CRUS|nr:EOG090X0ILG [Lynceus sp. MCZ IZ 141354]
MSDWESVTVLRKKLPKGTSSKSEQVVNAARRQGLAVDTVSKYGAATNKHTPTTLNTAKLDQETEELKHDKLSIDVGKLIQAGRQAKGWTQKDLATNVNEKPQVINDYEAGRGIPNQQILGKIERAIGMKLRGKDKGQALVPPGKK